MDDCLECLDKDTCKRCTTILFNGKCIPNCPSKTYKFCGVSTTTCVNCSKGCKTCNNDQVCRECDDGYIKLNKYCIKSSDCPPGKFVDNVNKYCKKCSIPFCLTCTEGSNCSFCKNGYTLSNGICNENKSFTSVFNTPFLFDEYTLTKQDIMKSINIDKNHVIIKN